MPLNGCERLRSSNIVAETAHTVRAISEAEATANVINLGGIGSTLYAADPFVMEHTDGLALNQVAWGELNPQTLSQQTRIITLDFDLEVKTPYLNQIQSSNAAAHILRTMQQSVLRKSLPGAFGDRTSKLVVVNSSDAYVVGIAGLLKAHWLLSGYQPDYCPPGGNLVFELREYPTSEEFFVRVFFTAQTFEQLRNLTPLTLSQPPASMQLFVPNSSKSGVALDIPFYKFEQLLNNAIGEKYVQDARTEMPPGVLTGVPR